ncbi:reverse transcriptase domain-containing protein, partial [Tanacetum coccineum]
MDISSKKIKCILHFNTFEEGVIFYDDMTYSMLLEFVVNRFNLDPNVRFNLSFNLPANERDITNDDDVEFFIDCATNSITDEIPHLYIRPPKVEARIIPGPYVRKVNEYVSEDDHFIQGPWLQAIVYLYGEGLSVSGCLGDMKKFYIKGKLELVVGVFKSCTPNSLGDITVTLKDPTGTMGGMIHYKVFQDEKNGYTKSIKVGYVLILRNVSVWTPTPSQHYLNITIRNIVKLWGVREMEQGFLNKSNKASLKNDGNMGSLLSELAKKMKNIDGKILGRDRKPVIPYRCVKDKVTFSDDVAVVMDNKNDEGEVGSFKSTSINTENNHGAAAVIGEDCTLADVIIPQEEVDTLSARFE